MASTSTTSNSTRNSLSEPVSHTIINETGEVTTLKPTDSTSDNAADTLRSRLVASIERVKEHKQNGSVIISQPPLVPSTSNKKRAKKRPPQKKALCEHKKRRTQCLQCFDNGTGGGSICKHRKRKDGCSLCKMSRQSSSAKHNNHHISSDEGIVKTMRTRKRVVRSYKLSSPSSEEFSEFDEDSDDRYPPSPRSSSISFSHNETPSVGVGGGHDVTHNISPPLATSVSTVSHPPALHHSDHPNPPLDMTNAKVCQVSLPNPRDTQCPSSIADILAAATNPTATTNPATTSSSSSNSNSEALKMFASVTAIQPRLEVSTSRTPSPPSPTASTTPHDHPQGLKSLLAPITSMLPSFIHHPTPPSNTIHSVPSASPYVMGVAQHEQLHLQQRGYHQYYLPLSPPQQPHQLPWQYVQYSTASAPINNNIPAPNVAGAYQQQEYHRKPSLNYITASGPPPVYSMDQGRVMHPNTAYAMYPSHQQASPMGYNTNGPILYAGSAELPKPPQLGLQYATLIHMPG